MPNVTVIEALVVIWAAGFCQGLPGRKEWAGMPFDLLLGLGCFGASFALEGAPVAPHLTAIGAGLMGAFLVATGRGMALAWSDRKDSKPQSITCDTHGAVPYEGHLVCSACTLFLCHEADAPEVCPCGVRFLPCDGEFSARIVCPHCYRKESGTSE